MAATGAAHAGAMVALFVPAPAAATLAHPGGEPAEDLHITLAFLGPDVDDLDVTADTVADVVAAVAAAHPPLTGVAGGAGWFATPDRDGQVAGWLSPDVVGLDQLRADLVAALDAAGVPIDTRHGFTPHITVAYAPATGDQPDLAADPTVTLSFDELTLAWAGQRTSFPLEGEPMATTRSGESFAGDRTHGETRELVQAALRERYPDDALTRRWVWVRDLTDTAVIFEVEDADSCTLWTLDYAIADDTVTLSAEPVQVEEKRTIEPVTASAAGLSGDRPPGPAVAPVQEAVASVPGRVLEAKGTASDGGRVFRMQIVEVGISKNGVEYSAGVLEAAAELYEGAKAFDHHRSTAELATSTVAGLVGSYRNIEATANGLEGDLHLLPSATHIAEALDASLEAQAAGLPPLVGVSHDVALSWREATRGDRRIKEATAVRAVLSVDVVADPSAGGRVTRTVEGGSLLDTHLPEETTMTTLKELLEGASDEDKASLATLLGGAPANTDPAGAAGTVTTEVTESRMFESTAPMGRLLIDSAVRTAGLDERLTESIITELGDRWSEADLAQTIETVKRVAEGFEARHLTPGVPHVQVTKEAFDKKVERLDRTLEGTADGYPGLKAAYADIAGVTGLDLLDAELAFTILRESYVGAPVVGMRQLESVDSTTWGQVLADSLHRRLVSVYQGNNFQDWKKLVSGIVPRTDFRPNHLTRLGGYGVLPAVAEGDSYDPLTSPTDEEASYTLTKRGGTEDLTLETIANDDIGAVRRIPVSLARAAAMTLYRFVVDTLFQANPTIFDSAALFHSSHANTTAAALSSANLAVLRRKMREQAAYGVAADVLGTTPKYLWVPPELEELAFQLCTSAVAVTSTGDSTLPNIHARMEPVVVDHWSDPTDWFVTADPTSIETIELGFFNGKQDPELFVQDDPKQGAAFSNDKITWKIRHIYSGAVVDYRGFQRGTVADA